MCNQYLCSRFCISLSLSLFFLNYYESNIAPTCTYLFLSQLLQQSDKTFLPNDTTTFAKQTVLWFCKLLISFFTFHVPFVLKNIWSCKKYARGLDDDDVSISRNDTKWLHQLKGITQGIAWSLKLSALLLV